jgi:hypothetical protein
MEEKTKLIQKTSIRKLHGAQIPTFVISTWSLGMGMPNFSIWLSSLDQHCTQWKKMQKTKNKKMLKMKNYHQIFKIWK